MLKESSRGWSGKHFKYTQRLENEPFIKSQNERLLGLLLHRTKKAYINVVSVVGLMHIVKRRANDLSDFCYVGLLIVWTVNTSEY